MSITYDAMGRMTFQTGVGAYAYRPLGIVPQNAPVTVNGLVTSYDAEGNWLTGFGGSAGYDRWEDQQAAQANSVRMYYDGDGVRVETLHSSVVDYVSNICEKNVTSGETTNCILFNDSMIARKRGGVVSYYHQDQLGSIAAISNTSGVIVLNKSYTPFGRVLAEPGLADPFGVGGQRMDITGLYNMGARQMAPGIGMFISPDPSDSPDPAEPQSLNRCAYANNSPVNFFDPSGFAAEQSWVEGVKSFIAPMGQELTRRGVPGNEASESRGSQKYTANSVIGLADAALMPSWASAFGFHLPQIYIEDNELEGAFKAELATNVGFVIAPLARVRGGVRLPAPTTADRVAELQTSIPTNSKGRITMAVGVAENANGAKVVLVSTSEKGGYFRPGVMLKPGEIRVKGTGHAEADLVSHANQYGLKLIDYGATRPICAACAALGEGVGARPVTPLKAK